MLEQYQFVLGIVASVVSIASGSLAVGKYLGRSGVIEEAANRLGVDLVTLALPPEPENPEMHTEERSQRETFLIEHFHPLEIEAALRSLANGSGVGFGEAPEYDTTSLVEMACSEVAPGAVIEIALDGEGAHPRKRMLGEHLTDEELSDLVDERGCWPDPINKVAQLEDDSSHAYAWILSEDATEEDRQSLAREIEETFIGMKANEPEALHFIVRDVEELRELDSETVESYVKPWLKDSSNQSEENR